MAHVIGYSLRFAIPRSFYTFLACEALKLCFFAIDHPSNYIETANILTWKISISLPQNLIFLLFLCSHLVNGISY